MKKSSPIDSRLLMGDLSDLITPLPQIERAASVREKATVCVAFITYLEIIGCTIAPPKDYSVTMKQLLCQFFGIQESVLQQEKLSLIGASCQEKAK